MSIPPFLTHRHPRRPRPAAAVAFYESLGWVRASSSMDEISWFGLSGGAVWLGLFPHEELAADAGLPREGAGDLPAYQGMTLAMNLASDEAVLDAFDDGDRGRGDAGQGAGTGRLRRAVGLLRGPGRPPVGGRAQRRLPAQPGRDDHHPVSRVRTAVADVEA